MVEQQYRPNNDDNEEDDDRSILLPKRRWETEEEDRSGQPSVHCCMSLEVQAAVDQSPFDFRSSHPAMTRCSESIKIPILSSTSP